MNFPGQVQQMGGSRPPLEDEASRVLAAARQRMEPRPRPPVLTPQERAEAEKAAESSTCGLCLAIHPLPNSPGCPRLLTFKIDGDGKVVEGTFRTDTKWHKRVVLVEDVHEDEESGDGVR